MTAWGIQEPDLVLQHVLHVPSVVKAEAVSGKNTLFIF